MGDVNPDLVLYRFLNACDDLLYIGKSINAWQRLTSHRRSWFFPEVAAVTLERGFATEDELRAAEVEAIRREAPRYNQQNAEPGAVEAGLDKLNEVLSMVLDFSSEHPDELA